MKTGDMRQELVNICGGGHALAVQILGNPDDAADAVQDALMTALAKPESYDASKGPIKPWFLRVVRNRCFDMLRRRCPGDEPVDRLVDPTAGPEQTLEVEQRDQWLKQALALIPSEQRQIIVLRDYLDLSYAEIAEVLDVAQGTVMSRLHRSRLALKEVAKGHEH